VASIAAIPKDPEARRVVAEQRMGGSAASIANRYREKLAERYGAAAKDIKYAEAFEICEYGRQPTEEQIRALFPFFSSK
jgi:hypothetical protein